MVTPLKTRLVRTWSQVGTPPSAVMEAARWAPNTCQHVPLYDDNYEQLKGRYPFV